MWRLQVNDYLLKAEEADAEEEQATCPKMKWAWERIAVAYLELAEMIERRHAA